MRAKIHCNYDKMNSGDIVTVYPDITADGGDIYNIPIGVCYLCEKDGVRVYIPASQIDFINETENQSQAIKYEKTIDWEQRRYELAKEAMGGILSNPKWDKASDLGFYKSNVVGNAISYADYMIEQLKVKKED